MFDKRFVFAKRLGTNYEPNTYKMGSNRSKSFTLCQKHSKAFISYQISSEIKNIAFFQLVIIFVSLWQAIYYTKYEFYSLLSISKEVASSIAFAFGFGNDSQI
jgi:hypothetical protein